MAIAVQVVQQHEIAAELELVIGRDLFAEQGQARVAVTSRHVTENLVVGSVLFDDVDHIFDRRGSPTFVGIAVFEGSATESRFLSE